MILIGMAGAAGAGKDTAADYLVAKHGFVKLSMAGPLKAGLAAMGLPEPANREDKERIMPALGFSWRQAAQTLGTEWGRALNPDLWVLLMERALTALAPDARVVISDVRFENEAEMIHRLGGSLVHLVGRRADLGDAAAHASEARLPGYCVDFVIGNDKEVSHLYAGLSAMVGHVESVQ